MTKLIVLATGGTGGHLFPAEALNTVLRARGYDTTFIVDNRTAYIKEKAPHTDAYIISSKSPQQRGLKQKLVAAHSLRKGYFEARRILKKLRPAAVVSFGGYAAAPTALAAVHLKIPLILHEPNGALGRAHRFIAKHAAHLTVGFPDVQHAQNYRHKTTVIGNPVRDAVAAVRDLPYPIPRADGPFTIFIVGGSQGATVFSNVIPVALALLSDTIKQRLDIMQQCRTEDIETVRETYRRAGINAVLSPFFDDVPQRLALAHLVIARSGGTVFELMAAGRPAILIPLPTSADDHQSYNARQFIAAGGGWLIQQSEFTSENLSIKLQDLINRPGFLIAAATAARAAGNVDAAQKLADIVACYASCS